MTRPRWKSPSFLLCLALVAAGIALRVAWPGDMEWKSDEQYMWERYLGVGRDEPWPWLGIASGVHVRNPGMSVWVFLLLGHLSRAETPVGLGMAVMAVNGLALVALLALVLRHFRERHERQVWVWGLALAAVNPILLHYHRKIWAQSVLPIFCVAWLWGFLGRRHLAGAFALGLVGAWLGQIHMSGFFYALAMTLTLLLFDRKQVHWKAWLAGSVLGALTLLPWLEHLLHRAPGGSPMVFGWNEALQLKAWVFLFTDSLGLSLGNSLGVRLGNGQLSQLQAFLREPLVAGSPTWLMAFAHGGILLSGALLLLRALPSLRSALRPRGDTGLLLFSAAVLFPALMTLSTIVVHRYYLLVTFPLDLVLLARLALLPGERLGRRLLATLVVLQLAVSATFLWVIHREGGARDGDYGPSFRQQVLERGASAWKQPPAAN